MTNDANRQNPKKAVKTKQNLDPLFRNNRNSINGYSIT